MFDKDQLDRYARHLILPQVGLSGQQRLLDASALVVGAGGLGSPILMYLAAAGIGRIGVIDHDSVELTNLHRQPLHGTPDVGRPKAVSAAERLHAINPEVRVEAHAVALTRDNARELVRRYDLVLDGSDNFPTRYLANDACVLEDRPLVYGAISQFEGQLSLFHARSGGVLGPCYRCLYPDPPEPGSVPTCAEAGVFGVLPGIVGSLMASEAIKLLLGVGEPLSGRLLHLDTLTLDTYRIGVERNPRCPVCGDAPSVTELIDYEVFCGVA
jgi:adenylyltransferase/sulfurtransferase